MAPTKETRGGERQQQAPYDPDPILKSLLLPSDLSKHVISSQSEVECDPVAESLRWQEKESGETDACEEAQPEVSSSQPENSAANMDTQKELGKRLKEMQSENLKLRRQVKQQFQDLSELDTVLGELEVQVDGHEVVIKQQDQKIQEQEQMIQELTAKMQQYVAALVCSAFRPTKLY